MIKKIIAIILITQLIYSQSPDSLQLDFKIGIHGGTGIAINHYNSPIKNIGVFFEQQYPKEWFTGGEFNYTSIPFSLDDTSYAVLNYIRLFPYFGKSIFKGKISLGVGPQMWFLDKANLYVNNKLNNELDSVKVFRDIWFRTVYGISAFIRYNIKISRKLEAYITLNGDISITSPKDPIFWPDMWHFENIGTTRFELGIQYKLYKKQ